MAAMVDDWWGHARQHAEWQRHPGDGRIPLLLFTDGFEAHRNQECESLLLQSMLRNTLRANADHNFLLMVCPLHGIESIGEFYERLSDYLAWQQMVLLSGHFPWTGFYNEEFPKESYRYKMRGQAIIPDARFAFLNGIICAWHGDIKARKVVAPFGRSYLHKNVCDGCLAQSLDKNTIGLLSFADLEDPLCLKFLLEDADVRAEMQGLHLRFLSIPYVQHAHLYRDWAHCRYLGVDRDVVASAMICWCRNKTVQAYFQACGVQSKYLRKFDTVLHYVWILCRSVMRAHGQQVVV